MALVSSGALMLEATEMVTLTVALNKFIDGRLVERKRRHAMWSEVEEQQLQRAIAVRDRVTELRKLTPFTARAKQQKGSRCKNNT